MRVMIGFLVWGRVRLQIRIRVMVRIAVGVMFNVSVYHWSNCHRSNCRIFAQIYNIYSTTVKVVIFVMHNFHEFRAKFSKREFKNSRKYLQYFVYTFWTHRNCVLMQMGLYWRMCEACFVFVLPSCL